MEQIKVFTRDIELKMSYDASNRIQYVGLGLPSSTTSSTSWQIFKLAYDATSSGIATKRFADSNEDFVKVWDFRTTYNYFDI